MGSHKPRAAYLGDLDEYLNEDGPGGGGGGVESVNAKTGPDVVLTADDIGDGNGKKVTTNAQVTKLDAIAAGATANSTDATLLNRANHTGTQTADSVVDGTANKVLTAAAKTKLDGVATGATANATDAQLVNRANHTGLQAINTVVGLQTALDNASAGGAVSSVNTKTGAVVLVADDIGEGSTTKIPSKTQLTKIDGVATGATANATDAQLRDRGTHTGTQAISTVTGLQTALDGKADAGSGGGGGAVNSVNSKTGTVVLTADDIGDGTTNKMLTATRQTKLDGIAAGATANSTDAQLRDRAGHTGTQSADTIVDGTTNKVLSAAASTKLTGIAAGATANSSDATLLARANHTGTQSADSLTDGTTNKAFTAVMSTKLAGVATGATANDTDANLKARANHTGTQTADTIVDGTTNKVLTAAASTKLAGIAAGATANSPDATLLARANHTGTQAIATVTGLQTALDGKANVGAGGAHLGEWYVLEHGAVADGVTDTTVALQAAMDAAPLGYDVIFGPGVYLISNYLRFQAGRRYRGCGYSRAYSAVIQQKDGANITTPAGPVGLFVPAAWATNQTTCDGQTIIENLCFAGNKDNNLSSTASGVILMNFWTKIRDCLIVDMPHNGILQTDVTINGTNIITNTASECDIEDNKITNCNRDGIKQISASNNSNLDGNMIDNRISYTGWSGISLGHAAGWTVKNNHLYGCQRDGIDAEGGFATDIDGNYIEGFGGEAADGLHSGTYYAGIYLSQLDGRGSTVTRNRVSGEEQGTGTFHHFIRINGGFGQTTARAVVGNNIIDGAGTSRGTGIVVQHSAGGVMVATGEGNNIRNVNTPKYVQGGDSLIQGPEIPVTPTARKYATGTQDPASGDVVAVTLDVEQYNLNTDYFDMSVANVIKAKKPGTCMVTAGLNFIGGASGERTGLITINGTVRKEFGLPGVDARPSVAEIFPIAIDDEVGVAVYTVGGTEINASASKDVTLSITWLGN